MAGTYQFNAIIKMQRFNEDWSESTEDLAQTTVEIDPPGDALGFRLADWGIELEDISFAELSYTTSLGPVEIVLGDIDGLGSLHPSFVNVYEHEGGETTFLEINRHVRVENGDGTDTLLGFDTIFIPITGAALPIFTTVEEFNDWLAGADLLNTTDIYPVGEEFFWADFDIDAPPSDGTSGNDTLIGTDGDDTLSGLGGDDLLVGGNGNDSLIGGSGNDTLLGGNGRDTLLGGSGDDILCGGLGSESDLIDGGAGRDTVDYSDNLMGFQAGGLTVNLETGRTSGSVYIGKDVLISIENANGTLGNDTLIGNSGDNVLNGLSGNDSLVGGGGRDRLDAGTGKDTMMGGSGNDTYITDGGDRIVEYANQGIDTVRSSASLTLGSNLENLVLTGSASINGTGNSLDNRLTGNDGNNVLKGGSGADTLIGGAGSDTLNGGAGADVFVFNSALDVLDGKSAEPQVANNVDKITQFTSIDMIHLDKNVFAEIGARLTKSEFRVISGDNFDAVDASDHIIYQKSTGNLYYDADGNGDAPMILFAQLAPGTALALDDFLMI